MTELRMAAAPYQSYDAGHQRVLPQPGKGRRVRPLGTIPRRGRTMIFFRRALRHGAALRTRRPNHERYARRRESQDALAAAIAIANAARRRRARGEALRGIAPIVALAIGIAICVLTITAMAAAPSIPISCTPMSDCPVLLPDS